MADTPIIDAAIRAGCSEAKVGCMYPECATGAFKCRPAEIVKAALRAALPLDLPAERLEARSRAFEPTVWTQIDQWETDPFTGEEAWSKRAAIETREIALERSLSAYRADLIMRELYPERFK